jgi:hypothetical protein
MLETTSNTPSTAYLILWIFVTKTWRPNTKLKNYLWFAGLELKKKYETKHFSRVDIELINEQIKLFYSDQDVVTITYDEDTFTITEYVSLGLNDKTSYYPLRNKPSILWKWIYKIENEMLFQPPEFSRKNALSHLQF